MAEEPIRVLLVDDQVLFREGLASLLRCQPDFEVAGAAACIAEAVVMAGEVCPDVVLMDFELPDGTGLDATRAILARNPGVAIVFLSVHGENDVLFAAIRAGASGYLQKNVRVEKLLGYLRGIAHGVPALEPEATGRILKEFARSSPPQGGAAGLDQLTQRELEIFDQLATGASNREIAASLFISENTIRNHVSNILSKLGLHNRHEAARYGRGRPCR